MVGASHAGLVCLRADRFGGLRAGLGGASIGRRGGFARFVNLAVAFGKLFLQEGQLFLLGLQSLTELFEFRCDRGVRSSRSRAAPALR